MVFLGRFYSLKSLIYLAYLEMCVLQCVYIPIILLFGFCFLFLGTFPCLIECFYLAQDVAQALHELWETVANNKCVELLLSNQNNITAVVSSSSLCLCWLYSTIHCRQYPTWYERPFRVCFYFCRCLVFVTFYVLFYQKMWRFLTVIQLLYRRSRCEMWNNALSLSIFSFFILFSKFTV